MEIKEKEYKESLRKLYPDMNVIYTFIKEKNTGWKTQKKISALDEKEFAEFNLIKQTPNQIILDIDNKELYSSIKERLLETNWSFVVWDTGSSGFHIYLEFENLASLELDIRDRVRRAIILKFGTDIKMAHEVQWLACPYSLHFKERLRQKLIIDSYHPNKRNYIDEILINSCKEQAIKDKQDIFEQQEEWFKLHWKDEPYLLYALENKIENGGRDVCLFKNLAVLLVKSGLPRDDIKSLAQRIANNCPGKTANEFMGWVDKVFKGDITQFNKDELVQWSIDFKHPIMYQLSMDSSELLTIKQLWDALWEYNVTCQPVWGDLCFFNMMGALLDERDDDLRVHVIFQSSSTSGKDEGVNLIQRILDRLDMKTYCPSEVTDKTLIGAVSQAAIDENIKHGVSESNLSNGKYRYKNEVEQGLLATANWIAFTEAESVFKPGSFNKKLQLILRQAMDKKRQVEKGVANRMLKVNTNTSFILTTYRMDASIYNILNNGLFQRPLFYNKEITDKDHKDIRTYINRKEFGSKLLQEFDPSQYDNMLVEKLNKVKIWYNENRLNFKYFDGCDIHINSLWEELEQNFSSIVPGDKDILNSIIRRASRNLKKMAVIYACSNLRTTVTQEDIKYCFNLIQECIESVKLLIAKQNALKKREYAILNYLFKNGDTQKGILYHFMAKQLKITDANKQTQELKRLQTAGLVTTYTLGRANNISLTELALNQFTGDDQ